MAPVRIACFVMSDVSHFNIFCELVAELARAGAAVRVWTDRKFEGRIQGAGAEFADLFERGTLEQSDGNTRPVPARIVAFSADHAEAIAAEVKGWGANLVVYESFAYVGRVVAHLNGLKWVVAGSGHAVHGKAFRAGLAADDRVALGSRCLAGVERLRNAFGLADANPFSHVADPSRFLNTCAEPEEWLDADEQIQLGPLAFFGALSNSILDTLPVPRRPGEGLRVYASFGTIIWRYWQAAGVAALAAVAEAVANIPGATAVLSLGGFEIAPEEARSLQRPGVKVVRYADQLAELARADLFVTHHGLGSTHEAVALGVPMLSHPFFWDQPALAARSEALGVALPLMPGILGSMGLLQAAHVAAGIAQALQRHDELKRNLARARRWEVSTLKGRPQVVRQILALAGGQA